MTIKPRYLIIAMALFLVLIFLDQNRTPVPLKIIVGNPFHLELTIIVIISVAVGALLTVGIMFLMNKRE